MSALSRWFRCKHPNAARMFEVQHDEDRADILHVYVVCVECGVDIVAHDLEAWT